MKTLLPIVSEEVKQSLSEEVLQDEDCLIKVLNRIINTNPKLVDIIGKYAILCTKDSTAAAYCATLVYGMLEKQAKIENRVLPIVSEGTANSIAQDILQSNNYSEDYLCSLVIRIDQENPVLARGIANYSLHTGDIKNVANFGFLVYRLLESQAEANRLKEEFE